MARRKITPVEIKNNNRKQIYDYIYKHGKVSQNDIAAALRLSRPTIATNVAALEEDGLIFKDGQQDSDQIGRKAAAYSIAADYRIAIGVELTGHHIKVIPVDLYGRKLSRTVWDENFENDTVLMVDHNTNQISMSNKDDLLQNLQITLR
jgi:predicted ArsR family transcriptional regulator